MATLNSIDLGIIESESQSKESSLIQIAMPRNDSDKAVLADILGVMRTITVSGSVTSGTKSVLQNFILAIEAIQDGKQTNNTYTGEFITTAKKALIQTFSWTWEAANPTQIKYDITIIEGNAI